MFARPDTGSTPISYPVPTWSAAKGMFDAVAWRPHAYIRPTRVEICKPILYERYVTNYGGPLRKQKDIRENNSYQFHATIVADVCYRIYGDVEVKRSTRGKDRPQLRRRRGRDWAAELKRLFDERLSGGHTFYTPCLGWKEFVPTYFGPLRERDERGDKVEPVKTGEIHIPAMLASMWEHGQFKPSFHERWIVDGVMCYERERPVAGVSDAQ